MWTLNVLHPEDQMSVPYITILLCCLQIPKVEILAPKTSFLTSFHFKDLNFHTPNRLFSKPRRLQCWDFSQQNLNSEVGGKASPWLPGWVGWRDWYIWKNDLMLSTMRSTATFPNKSPQQIDKIEVGSIQICLHMPWTCNMHFKTCL